MRLLLRVTGTWLLALSLVLLIIDGTRSLGASELLTTPVSATWTSIHEPSLLGLREFLQTRFFGVVLLPILDFILALPGFVVLAVPGLMMAFAGRSRRSRLFVRQDQI